VALAETAELAVKLTLDDKMTPAIRKAQGGLHTLGNTARTVGKGIAVGTGIVATAGIIALTGAIKSGIAALKEDKVISAQTAAVIKSTGGAAGVTANHVEDLADQLSTLDGVQDDVVQGAENVILRFTSIGADIFPQVTQAALDMPAATGTDAASAALKLSRAIDNPVKSLTALSRAGIIFTDQEKAQITDLVKHNKLREAQAIVLAKVKQKFDGVAQAQADADPGRRLAVSTERFQKALASGLLPVIEKVQTRLSEWLIKPETIAAVTKIGDAIGALFTDENLNAAASAIETAAKAVGTAITAFNQLPGPIKALAIGAFAINKVTGGAIGGAASALGKVLGAGLSKIFAANVTVITPNLIGGGGGIPGVGGAAGSILVGGALPVILTAASIAALGALLVYSFQHPPDVVRPGVRPSEGGDVIPIGRGFGPRSGHGVRSDVAGTGISGLTRPITDALVTGFNTLRAKPISAIIGIDALTPLLETNRLTGYLKELVNRVKDLKEERRQRRQSGDREGTKLITARLDSIAKREAIVKQGIDDLKNSNDPKLTKIQTHIDIEKNYLASLQRRLHIARESHDAARAHRIQGKIDATNTRLSNLRSAEQNQTARVVSGLDRVVNAVNNQKTTSVNVSVRDFNAHDHTHSSIARDNRLSSGHGP